MRLRHPVAVALALLAFTATSASAALFGYAASISATQEVPTNPSTATGAATFIHDDVAHTLTYSLSFQGLTQGLSAAHIHGPAAAGANAGVLHFFPFNPLLGQLAGSWNGSWTAMTPTQESQLASGLFYVNIRTTFRPGGEIRGQILPNQAVPTQGTSWGRIKSLYR